MTEETKRYYDQIVSLLDTASGLLSPGEYMKLCAEVEASTDARYQAMEMEGHDEDEG